MDTIKVTKKHIKKGLHSSSNECPVALAILEKYSKMGYEVSNLDVSTGGIIFTLTKEERGVKYTIEADMVCPDEAWQFITLFDAEEKVKPIEFSLSIPIPVLL